MSGPTSVAEFFEVTTRNRAVRRPAPGKYNNATVYDILNAALLCHIAYLIDGQPYSTPTLFWREVCGRFVGRPPIALLLRPWAKLQIILTCRNVEI
jgi:hypothetical protein